MTDASTTALIALPNGPLTSFFTLAEQNNSLAVYTFEQFADPAGVALVGASDYCVALVDPADDTAVKVAGKSAGGTGTSAPDGKAKRFEGAEHIMIGDSIILRTHSSDRGNPSPQVPLRLGKTPSRGTTGKSSHSAATSLAALTCPSPTERLSPIRSTASLSPLRRSTRRRPDLAIMQTEINALNAALAAGVLPDEAYKALGDRLSGQWNRLTGGGGIFSYLWPMGRYLQLASVNWDHFGKSAIAAYQAGHAAAMDQAYKGWMLTQEKQSAWAHIAQLCLRDECVCGPLPHRFVFRRSPSRSAKGALHDVLAPLRGQSLRQGHARRRQQVRLVGCQRIEFRLDRVWRWPFLRYAELEKQGPCRRGGPGVGR